MIKKTFNPANPFDLKDLGLKATGPRLKILDLFIKNADSGKKRHMSARRFTVLSFKKVKMLV